MTKTGRNAPCPCGSGKKYKKCCLKAERARGWAASDVAKEDEDVDGTEIIEDEEFEVIPEDPEIPDEAWHEDGESEYVTIPDPKRPEPVSCPKPPKDDPPDLPDEQQRLVDEWWAATKVLFKGPDADGMIAHLVRFMEEHPPLVAHLGIEHEYLFELGAELGRRKEWSRYAELLMRVRKAHPEVYVRSFGYYDYDVIIELIVTGQRELVPRYFDFFHQYPDSDPDSAHKLIELLAWTGLQEELFEFVRPIAVPICRSPDVIGGGFALRWVVLEQYVPLLDAGTDPDEAAAALLASLEALELTDWWNLDQDVVRREFEICRGERLPRDYAEYKTGRELYRFYHDVAWDYCAFLHQHQGLSWVRADFLAGRLADYWSDRPANRKPTDPFRLIKRRMDEHLMATSRDFLWINGVRAASFIEAVWRFADYLSGRSWLDEAEERRVRDMCREFLDAMPKMVDSTDPVPRLMPALPNLTCPWARDEAGRAHV